MTDDVVIDLTQEMFKVCIMVGGPLLISGLFIGLIVSILQAVTQINEATLSFLPKIAIVLVVMIVLGPWMMDVLVTYTKDLYDQIPIIIRE